MAQCRGFVIMQSKHVATASYATNRGGPKATAQFAVINRDTMYTMQEEARTVSLTKEPYFISHRYAYWIRRLSLSQQKLQANQNVFIIVKVMLRYH